MRFAAGLLLGLLLVVGLRAWNAREPRPEWTDAERAMAPRMHAFVRALAAPPENRRPAPGWSPLLRDPSAAAPLCATCHGARGRSMERAVRDGSLDVARDAPALGREEMVALMEAWVSRLNREAAPLLRKAVGCVDCHARDPRRE